ncbi:hypothetical protein [Paracoccus marinaquae]|uniref:AAA+ family ATPase n=1 Tax=Paracoccus marinaquae TaxID=2841926 RepID=A0ABS6AFN4_9RHOB|nr:hypothetical protein [Paracoccus marinaquae]MBU3029328.1 hypothetical protein [Paracoccus marinaquae]
MTCRTLALTACILALPLGAAPVQAQTEYEPPLAEDIPEAEDGLSLIERGIGAFMEEFWQDVGPDLNQLGESMSSSLSRMTPVLEDLSALIDDLGNYQAPERLEGGDIIIRRKPGAPPPPVIGEGLRDAPAPDGDGLPAIPRDPYAPEVEL